MIKLLVAVLGLTVVAIKASTLDVAPNNALPEVIRQSASSTIRVANEHSAAEIQQETIANASATLSNTSFSDIENDNLTLALQLKYRERKKQERLTLIRNQILSRLHMNQQPNISSAKFSEDEQSKIATFMERLQDHNSQSDGSSTPRSSNTIQWLQSFYPSCSTPNNTDKLSWEQPGTFRIFYDIPFSRYPPHITVMAAKLRLYKTIENTDPNFVGFDPTRPRYNALEGLVNSRAANGISVSIYQIFRPLRTNKREKKRLVDSQTVSIDYEGWVEFNVNTPLNYWHRHSNRNYGFDVEVEDAFGNKLNPNLHFLNMNCSSEILDRDTPFPNIMEIHRGEVSKNDSSLFDNETYPTLDLKTTEVPHDIEDIKILTDGLEEHVMRKRSSDNDTCRKELEYVAFSDVGLDEFILWPQGVLWTFCDGGCGPTENTPKNLEYYFSSWFQRLLKLKRKTMSDCTVTRRESLPVIIYDGENQVLETVLEDFVPISCGCRAS